ncbi:hypothetical protein [Rhodopirellula sp. P2]|uniref:hypothetical protein n=1 Tax=Rhodopirellula sp. P2 TaxID=2127060 RepID=UPI002368E13D|nr:hypothetical protein [Rhodopirellula sp. P2]WDQ19222.1 hypothetical protein PSR62_11980 [Rhodopirellula sp. P2]
MNIPAHFNQPPKSRVIRKSCVAHELRPDLRRSGSAVVLSFLAMAVLSLAAISIVRSHRRSNVRSASVRQQVEGRLVAEGLIHRNVALARANGALPVASLDAELASTSFPDAWMAPPVIDVANQTVSLQVYMYPGATVPAASLTTAIPSVPPAPLPMAPAPAVVPPSAF